MKKVLAVILVVSVVFGAGAAIAQPKRQPMQNQLQRQKFVQSEHGNQNVKDQRPEPMRRDFGARDDRGPRPEMMGPNFGECDRGPRFAPDMPKEIREKVAELAKLKIDLEEALTSNPINKAKALEVYAKIQQVKNEIDAWKFAKRLEFMEKAREQRELNRKNKPVPPAPKPEEKPEVEPEKSPEE